MDIKINYLEIENIKNVESGRIDFFRKDHYLNLIGVYGQNGSGKTTLVDAFSLLNVLMCGIRDLLASEHYYDLLTDDIPASITLCLDIPSERKLIYKVILEREQVNKKSPSLNIVSETLETRSAKPHSRLRQLITYDLRNKQWLKISNAILKKKETIDDIVSMQVASKLSQQNHTSFLFSQEFYECLVNRGSEKSDLSRCIDILKHDFNENLFIHTVQDSGFVSTELIMPFSFNVQKENACNRGKFTISQEPQVVPNNIKEVLNQIIKQINIVLPRLVPGLTIQVEELGKEMIQDEVSNKAISATKIQLLSIRDNKSFPFKAESDGIKKIVSILSALITVYNTPGTFVILDELDAGVFEYLLGELVSVISQGAKGQILFTSHNLRVLEMLNPENLIFTTINPKHRYVTVNGIRPSNNLRDMYIRALDLGNESGDSWYSETDTSEIRRAFRSCSQENITI